ncbi:MAG TPA: hypothetical protein VHE55_16860 [Fimbriimonadaceae bacterium]|nr:hypothetical protein [Fimbriimonadaceae bacterium]
MLAVLLSAALAHAQTRYGDMPKIVYELPIIGGQREVVLGAKPSDFTLLNGYYEKEIGPKHIATGDNTGGYVDSWTPSGMVEDSLGYFDCSSRPGNIFNKPCIVITSTAKWNQKIGKKPQELKWQNFAKQQWWVSEDGKILRHYSTLQTPEGVQTGDCTYGKDSVQRRYTDIRGETSFGEIFPACGFDALNAQFTPMVVDGKVVLRDKDYCVVNPLTGGIDKYSVHSAGTFRGEYLGATFQGKLFEIDAPNHLTEKAFIDNGGDLVKVALSDEKFFVINVVPSDHLDQYGHPIRKSGGG